MKNLFTLATVATWSPVTQRNGKRLVATNGCFDLLHVGHMRHLQMARTLGDWLVVGLNSDASVRLLKGTSRPLMEQAHRAEMLLALRCVDAVVIFEEPRATGFLRAVRPDVYVKSGDYNMKNLNRAELRLLQSIHAEIAILPAVEGISTTVLIQRIQKML